MDQQTVKIGKKTFTILFPDLVPRLSDKELVRLRKSIKRSGIITPVIVDEDDGVIDGANRLNIAAELKLPASAVPTEVRKGLSLEGKAELCCSLNVDRRQMTAGVIKRLQKERDARIERVAAARREGQSLRTIAEREGISNPQVLSDVRQATAKGLAVDPEGGKSTGRDGRQQPASHGGNGKPFFEEAPPPCCPACGVTFTPEQVQAINRQEKARKKCRK